MSKNRSIGRKIHNGVALNKLVTPNMQKAIQRRDELVKKLNRIIDNKELYSPERRQRAKTALRKLYAQSHAIHESKSVLGNDAWRDSGKLPAVGRDKAKRKPSQPRVEFSKKVNPSK